MNIWLVLGYNSRGEWWIWFVFRVLILLFFNVLGSVLKDYVDM